MDFDILKLLLGKLGGKSDSTSAESQDSVSGISVGSKSSKYLRHCTEAFAQNGTFDVDGKNATVSVHQLGSVHLPSGRLVACDPATCAGAEPFKFELAPGDYPVSIAVAEFKDDQRVAYARVQFADADPVSWDLALTISEDRSKLKRGEYFGYGVDAGIGCFMSYESALLIQAADSDEISENIADEMGNTYRHTWSWTNHMIDRDKRLNTVVFSSGWGDGFYPSFISYDERGALISLVTEFFVLR